MADHTLTPDELAMIDATVARVAADRADAGIMGARYDAACEQIVKLLDEATAQRRRIAELEQEAGSAVGTAGALRARVLELEMRETARNERIKELEGALASAEDFCTRPNACGALMDAALERARENGETSV